MILLHSALRGIPVFKPFIHTDTDPLCKVPLAYYDSTYKMLGN